MADKKISALTAATTPLDGTEVLPLVQSGATVKVANNDLRPKQIQSNATSGVLQIAGPAAASTRVATVPDANFTVARTDAGQTFAGDEVFSTSTGFTRGNSSTAGVVIGDVGSGGSFLVRTPSVNGSFGSGFAVDGTYSGGLSTVNLRAIGVNSGGAYTSKWSFWTTDQTTLAERATLDVDFTLKSGNFVVGTSGKGIDFSATPGTGTSELLADYEEGTWTPNQGSGLTVTGAFSSSGNYTKVGRVVTVYGRLTGATTIAAAASGILTTNMPYAGLIIATGTAGNSDINSGSIVELSDNTLYSITAIGGGASTIFFTITYPV